MTTLSEQEIIMKKHGITCEKKCIYKYKNYQYDDLQQAINYAVFDQKDRKSMK